jgi:orotate phosphoribosyltransferase
MSLAFEINKIAKLNGHFKLRSGKITDTYFDKYKFESNPQLLYKITNKMKKLIPQGTQVLAGLELGGIPIVTLLSYQTGIEAAFIRKEAKSYGTCKYAEGAELRNKKVVIIEDVVSSGGAIIDAVSKMRNDGIDVNLAICVIDRQTGGKEKLKEKNIKLISLFTQSELENAEYD